MLGARKNSDRTFEQQLFRPSPVPMHPVGLPRKPSAQPQQQVGEDEEWLEAASIEAEKLDQNGQRMFLIKWVGLPASHNCTWEPEENLRHLGLHAKSEKKRLSPSAAVPLESPRLRPKRQRAVPEQETRKAEAILGERKRGGESQFFVKWVGYDVCSWEPRQAVQRLLVFAEYLRSRLPVADAQEGERKQGSAR